MALLVASHDSGERGGEVDERIDSVELASLDERGNGRPALRSRIVPGKERILSIEGNRPDSSFDRIVVDLDAPVSQENAKTVPVFGDVGERFSERRLASDAGTMLREPRSHVRNHWC